MSSTTNTPSENLMVQKLLVTQQEQHLIKEKQSSDLISPTLTIVQQESMF
jgi:hypothetical protein